MTVTKRVYDDGTVTISNDGFMRVGGVPFGVLQKNGAIRPHQPRNKKKCRECPSPSISIAELAEMAREYGV